MLRTLVPEKVAKQKLPSHSPQALGNSYCKASIFVPATSGKVRWVSDRRLLHRHNCAVLVDYYWRGAILTF